MRVTMVRQRYTQLFIISLLIVSLYAMTQSMTGGILQFQNQFWGRTFLLSSFTRVRLALGDRVFQDALIGKQGWMEYIGDGDLDIYQTSTATSEKTLNYEQQKLQKLYDELRKRNITLILIIPPNKASIYPENLPDEIQKPTAQSKLDAFTAYIQKHGPPILVDLRPGLLNERKKHDVYYKTDSHWNGYGIFNAYTEIFKELSKTYPQLTPKGISDFKITTEKPSIHDVPHYISAPDLLESDILFTPKEDQVHWATISNDWIVPIQISTTPDKNLPSLLMYMDSFGAGMKKIIAPHFSQATFILNHSTYPDTLSLDMIDAVKPNVVIIEFVERFFVVKKMDAFLNKLLPNKKK